MAPSYAIKKGVRYRCYVSCVLAQGRKEDPGSVKRVAADEVEQIVLRTVARARPAQNPPTAIVADTFHLIRIRQASAIAAVRREQERQEQERRFAERPPRIATPTALICGYDHDKPSCDRRLAPFGVSHFLR
jgi:hypothetical protein